MVVVLFSVPLPLIWRYAVAVVLFCFSGCLLHTHQGSLKTLSNLQSMKCWQLANIMPTSNVLLNTPFGDEPSPLHFRFQAASVYQTVSIGSLKPTPAAQYVQSPRWRNASQSSRLPAYSRRSPRRISLAARYPFYLRCGCRLSGCLVAQRRLGRFAAA